ncbi:hypothetical protein BGZ96_010526 [Linnemannia gamsii]|uniref:FAD-binding domain-containing protein n=1 Tax=Linnemannia gamsii TaxID=64522 RepID=A0ABQ7JUH6_9FUNG|nr:hypothetical protein BGZ96_010526 [Linnemannia gamsii]
MEINPAVTFKHDRSVMYAKRPKVLIVGAGLAGLTLGMLLDKAGIPFEIYERAPKVKPLAGGYIVARPKLYDLLYSQVPPERLHMGKKVLSMDQGGNGVILRFSDGTEAEGDILVGADGAYSAVRQGLYDKLKKEKRLPTGDGLPLPFTTIYLVGQTRPLTAEEFPDVDLPDCQFRTTIGTDKPFSWKTFTTKQKTVCWIAMQFLDDESSKENDAFRNSEWGPEAAQAMSEQVRDFPVISGRTEGVTIGDLIDWSPKEMISKVMLEEKVFETWFDCRTVLIGDACHKFNPSGGVGATNAINDAIVLANVINGLPFHPIASEIEDAFRDYKKERIEWVKKAFSSSAMFRTQAGPTLVAKTVRFVAKHISAWAMRKVELRVFSNRPSAAFLPLQEDTGSVRPVFQPSLLVKAPVEEKNDVEGGPEEVVVEGATQAV